MSPPSGVRRFLARCERWWLQCATYSARTRRDLHHLDPGASEHRVEGVGELPGPVADQEPELSSAFL
jgi:hypothetical protein